MTAADAAVLRCRHCAADVPACFVGIDIDAVAAALRSNDAAQLHALGVWRCSACARCDALDPLTLSPPQWCRLAQSALQQYVDALQQAHAARQRFHARNARLAREADARAQVTRQAADASKSAVAAALARAGKRSTPAADR